MYAVDDEAQEGDRTVAISHSVIAPDPADRTAGFDGAAVRNVEVLVRDNDVPGVTIIQVTPAPTPRTARPSYSRTT